MRKTDLTGIDGRRRIVGGSLLLAAALAVTSAESGPAAVADPTGRPAATAPATATASTDARGRRGGGSRLQGQPPTAGERTDALAFMSKHAPVRYKAMQGIANPQDKAAVETFAVRTIVALMRSERDDPELYKTAVQRIETEDVVFDLAGKVHRAGSGPDASDLRKQLHDQVAADVDVRLKEQRLRLDRLRQTVEREQQRLDHDVAHRDKLVDDQFDHILTEDAQRPFPGGGGRHNRMSGEGTDTATPDRP